MPNIWLISDTHFNHDKEFIWKTRGFNSVWEMNNAIIENWNNIIKYGDTVYHLGDFIMGDLTSGINIIKRLNGNIKLAIGNHDTDARIEAFNKLYNIEDIQFGYRIKKGKKTFILTHYPTLTGNYDNSKTYSIHGHTHSLSPFCEHDMMYNVNCDAHNCQPIAWEDMLIDIEKHKVENK